MLFEFASTSGDRVRFLGGSPQKKTQKRGPMGFQGPPKRYKLTRDHGPLSDPRWPGGRKGQKEAGEAGKKQ